MKRNRSGFTLMELAISIALIGILVGVVAAGGGMMGKFRVQREAQAVDNLRVAAQNYLSASNMTYSGVSVAALKTAGYIPNAFNATGSNSFAGDYTVSANTADNTRVDIILASIPVTAATDLTNAFKAKANATNYDAATKVWTGTF